MRRPRDIHRANRGLFFDPFLRVSHATQNRYCYGTDDGHRYYYPQSVPHDAWGSQNRKIKCMGSELDLGDEKLGTPCSCFQCGRASVRAASASMPLSACLTFCLFTLMAPRTRRNFSPLSTPHCSQHALLLSPTFLTSHFISISLALEPSLEPGTQRSFSSFANKWILWMSELVH